MPVGGDCVSICIDVLEALDGLLLLMLLRPLDRLPLPWLGMILSRNDQRHGRSGSLGSYGEFGISVLYRSRSRSRGRGRGQRKVGTMLNHPAGTSKKTIRFQSPGNLGTNGGAKGGLYLHPSIPFSIEQWLARWFRDHDVEEPH